MKARARWRINVRAGGVMGVRAETNTLADARDLARFYGTVVDIEKSNDAGLTWRGVETARDNRFVPIGG